MTFRGVQGTIICGCLGITAAITGASEVLYISNYGHDHYQLWWETELGLPWEGDNRKVWEHISPFNKVQHVTTPTLIMGGEDDWNVPILNSEQLYQALRRRGVPTQLVVYPGQGHGLRVPSYQKDRLERYLACRNPGEIIVSKAMDGLPQRRTYAPLAYLSASGGFELKGRL